MPKQIERVRLGLSVSPETKRVLDGLARSPRFESNRSKAASWAIRIGARILEDPALADVLFGKPEDAVEHYRVTRGSADFVRELEDAMVLEGADKAELTRRIKAESDRRIAQIRAARREAEEALERAKRATVQAIEQAQQSAEREKTP